MSSRMRKFEVLLHLAMLYSTILLGIFIRDSKSMPMICCACVIINILLYKSTIFDDYNFDALYYVLLIISDANVIITTLYAYYAIAGIIGIPEIERDVSCILIIVSLMVACFKAALNNITDMLHLYGMELSQDVDGNIEYIDSQEIKPTWVVNLMCKVSTAIMIMAVVVLLGAIHFISHLYRLSIIALVISSLLLVEKIVKELKINGTKEV